MINDHQLCLRFRAHPLEIIPGFARSAIIERLAIFLCLLKQSSSSFRLGNLNYHCKTFSSLCSQFAPVVWSSARRDRNSARDSSTFDVVASSSARDYLRSAPQVNSLSSLSSLLEGEGTLTVPVKLGIGISGGCSSDLSLCVIAATLRSFSFNFLVERRTLPSSWSLKSVPV